MRNIVLISLESLRADHCGFTGYHRDTTPFLDSLARESVIFRNAVSSGNQTSESMIGVFTGESSHIVPHGSGVNTFPGPWRKELARRRTLAEMLSDLGYSTIGFSPNPLLSSYYGFNKGFDLFEDFMREDRQTKSGSWPRKLMDFVVREKDFSIRWQDFYSEVTDAVKVKNVPFFLWVFLLDTHWPYDCPAEFRRYGSSFDFWRARLENFSGLRPSRPAERKRVNLYDDSIGYVDRCVERFWHDLREYDPIYVIHGDHGEAFGEHGFYGHGLDFFYEENTHVPLLIHDGRLRGEVIRPVSLMDLPATMEREDFVLGGVQEPDGLLPIRDWVISKTFDSGLIRMSVRKGSCKFILREEEEFYDLASDPFERENRIGEPSEIREELQEIARAERKSEKEKLKIRNSAVRLRKVVKQ